MQPEFWPYSDFQKPQFNEIANAQPQNLESHVQLFELVQQELHRAGNKIKSIWETWKEQGIQNAAMLSELTGNPYLIEFYKGEDLVGAYELQYQGSFAKDTWQSVDAFSLSRKEGPNSLSSSITIITRADTERRFYDLAAMGLKDEDHPLQGHSFYFIKGELAIVYQQSQPQVLLRTPHRPFSNQFIAIQCGFSMSDDTEMLSVRLGFQTDDELQNHSYINIGGDLIAMRKIRLQEDEMELFEETPDGKKFNIQYFSLPKAIANIAEFEPATAA